MTLTTRGELAELSAFLTDLMPDLRSGDTFLHAAPIAHASGAFFLPSLVRGARSLVMAKFDPAEFVQLAARRAREHYVPRADHAGDGARGAWRGDGALPLRSHRLWRLADRAGACCNARKTASAASSRRPTARPKARW